ncbi:MAG: PDZ domain-containing protein [Gemmatimonadota bacterium]|nr:MAG: PDZ domain-containing protein [Gemmatimonadota bacterium]
MSYTRWAGMLLAGTLLMVSVLEPAVAQEEKEKEECVCPTPWGQVMVWPREGPRVMWLGQRAKLGVYVHTEANPETDSYGALLDGVTKGGPAAKAGLQEGDIITSLNGASLLSGGGDYDEGESAPGMRLVERARELEGGDTVQVEYRRDGKAAKTELVAGDFDDTFDIHIEDFGARLEDAERIRGTLSRLRELPQIHFSGPETFALRVGERLPGLELVSLNPDLGDYFGTSEGVLVVNVPEESELGLRAGDVLKRIDGRDVRSPSHAMRILRSYEADEEVSFQIYRQKRETTVSGKIPEALGGTALRIIREEKK